MKKKCMKFLYTIILAIFVVGCDQKVTGLSNLKEIKVDLQYKTLLDISDIEDKVEFIKLETNEACLIHEIKKICYVDSLLIIGDYNSIYFFDSNGVFRNKIDKKGNGPEEYNRLSDFDIDRIAKIVTILDTGKQQLLRYNFRGEYLGSINVGIWAIKLLDRGDKYYLYSGNQVSEENSYKINVIDKASGDIRGFYGIPAHKSEYLHIHSSENFCFGNNTVYLYEGYNDTIYELSSQKVDPVFHVNFSHKNIPEKLFDMRYENIAEFSDLVRKNDYVYGVFYLVDYKDKFIFSFYDKKRFFTLFDGNKTVVFDKVLFSGISSTEIDLNEYYVEFWNDENNIFFTSQNALYLRNYEDIRIKSLKMKVKYLKEDDNGIIGILKK